jgi:hypothetical protein
MLKVKGTVKGEIFRHPDKPIGRDRWGIHGLLY